MTFSAWNSAVEAIYLSASAPSCWPNTLYQIAQLLDADGGILLYRHDSGTMSVIVSPNLVEMAKDYAANWQNLDVRAERGFQAFSIGHRDVVTDRQYFSDEEISTLPIYQEFLLPYGFLWSLSASVSPTSSVSVMLTLLRAKHKSAYTEEDENQMLAISRHVERSLSLSVRLMDAEAERLGLSEALDRVSCGVFILDAQRRVLLANRTVDQLLGEGLAVLGGQFTVTDRVARRTFQQRLDAILSNNNASFIEPLALESLVVPNGDRGLILQILPIQPSFEAPVLVSASVVVLAVDQEPGRSFDPALVRDVFKLTLGEARLAALVGAGTPPCEATAKLGIADTTARTVLKRVFDKMGVSRQSEMAVLMGKLFMLRQP